MVITINQDILNLQQLVAIKKIKNKSETNQNQTYIKNQIYEPTETKRTKRTSPSIKP